MIGKYRNTFWYISLHLQSFLQDYNHKCNKTRHAVFQGFDPQMVKKGWKSHSTPSITLGLIDTYLVFILICWKSRKTSMILVFGNKTRHTHFLHKHGFLRIFHNLKCFPIHSFRGTNYIMHCKHDESMKTLNLWFYQGM